MKKIDYIYNNMGFYEMQVKCYYLKKSCTMMKKLV